MLKFQGTLQNSAFFLSVVSITFQLLPFKFSEYANLPIMSLNLTDKLIKFPLELGTIKYSLKRHLSTIERVRATISLKKLLDFSQRKPCSNTLNIVTTLCRCRLHSCGLSLNVGNSSFHLTGRFTVNNGCIRILLNTHLREHQQYVIICLPSSAMAGKARAGFKAKPNLRSEFG